MGALNNGSFIPIDRGTFGTDPAQRGNFATVGGPGGASVTYTFATSVNISQIDVYSGWQDTGRYQQSYVVSYLLAGASEFTVLNPNTSNPSTPNPVNYNNAPGGPTVGDPAVPTPVAVRTSLTAAAGGNLAENITAIKFEFLPTENAWTGYAEIDVFGTVIPEPSSALLISVGLLGAMRRRR